MALFGTAPTAAAVRTRARHIRPQRHGRRIYGKHRYKVLSFFPSILFSIFLSSSLLSSVSNVKNFNFSLLNQLHFSHLWFSFRRAAIGYPVVKNKVVNFTKNIPNIIRDLQEDINSQFPDMNLFRKTSKKAEKLSFNTKIVKAWIGHHVQHLGLAILQKNTGGSLGCRKDI